MQVGVAVPQSWSVPETSMRRLRDAVTLAEDGGLDSLWVQEQLIGRDTSFEPLTTLAFVSAITDRIRIGAAGVAAPLRSPLALAKAFATIDQFSLGRLDVGLVLGEMAAAYSATRADWALRGARLEDTIAVLRALWSGRTVSYSSPFVLLEETRITPPPVQIDGPPIWIGAKRGRGLERAARLADGWIGAGGVTLQDWRRSRDYLKAYCDRNFLPKPKIGKKFYLWIDKNEAVAHDRLSEWFAVHWGAADGGERASKLGVFGPVSKVRELLLEMSAEDVDLIILNPVGEEIGQIHYICESLIEVAR